MGEMSIREFNSNVSKTIARVEAGEALDITRNGRVVVRIIPARRVRDVDFWKAHRETKEMLRKGLPINAGKTTWQDKYGEPDL